MNALAPIPVPEALPLVQPVVRQRQSLSGRFSFARRAIGPLAIVAAWAIATTAGWIDPSVLPSPTALLHGFRDLWTNQALLHQIGTRAGSARAGRWRHERPRPRNLVKSSAA